MMSLRIIVFVLAGMSLAGAQTNQPPTATEIFNLRSLCTSLGEKLLQENALEPDFAHQQTSHYQPRTNRCYVEINVHSANIISPDYQLTRYLYDGQTKELLAMSKVELKNNKQYGRVYDPQHGPEAKKSGYEETQAYIDERTFEDRK